MKYLNLYKQYGLKYLLNRILFIPLKYLVQINKFSFLIIPNHQSQENLTKVKSMDIIGIESWISNNIITKNEAERFITFLENNCKGYYIEIENELAAWGFVQTKGVYQYGKYLYALPNNVHMLKNLFVKPKFRGLSLGKLINEARINDIPDTCIPCGFVIPENRYAIRNLKMFGFEECLSISHTNWFKSFTKTTIKNYKKDSVTKLLIDGFQKNNKI